MGDVSLSFSLGKWRDGAWFPAFSEAVEVEIVEAGWADGNVAGCGVVGGWVRCGVVRVVDRYVGWRGESLCGG